MIEKSISIMVDSASRPDLLERCIASLQKHVNADAVKLIWMFHEAVIRSEDSERCIEIAKRSGLFSIVKVEPNPRGQGVSITQMLEMTESPYFLYWVDDHVAIRDIDIDSVVDCMNTCPDVNQITLHKRQIMSEVSGFKKGEVVRNGLKLTTSPHWRYMPSLWRMAWIWPRWQCFEGAGHHWQMNNVLQGGDIITGRKPRTVVWVIDKMGTYYLGGIGEQPYCESIGQGRGQRNPEYK